MKTFVQKILIFVGPICWAPIGLAQSQLQEIVVTSSRVETPVRQIGAAVTVVSKEEIALRGANSLAQLLRTQPGVAVSNGGGPGKATSLRIRGEEEYRTLVMIDGLDVSDPTGTQVGPRVQHMAVGNSVERVEVLRGPQGFIYGADSGGVVNIITRTVDGTAGAVSLEGGEFNTRVIDGFIASGGERGDVFVALNRSSTDGFNAYVEDLAGDDDGYRNTTLHSKFGVRLSDTWRGQLVVRSTDAENEYDNCGDVHACKDDFEQNIGKLSLHYHRHATEQRLSVARTLTERSNFALTDSTFSAQGEMNKFEYLGSVAVTPALTTVWGADIENEEITANSGETGDRNQFSIFSEVQTEIGDGGYLSFGMRFDDNEDFGTHWSARVASAIVRSLGDHSVKYRASWGSGFRAPSLSEIFYNRRDGATEPAASVVLQEETSEGFDLGIEFYSVRGHSLQLGYFDQKIEDEIYFDLLNFSGYLQGDGVSHSRGGELAFVLPLGSSISLQGNYTYNETLSDDDTTRARRPRHLANLALQFSTVDEGLRLFVNARAARDAVTDIYNVGRVPLDDYEVVDASVHFQPQVDLTLSVRVDNVLNEEYQEITDYNTSRRAFYAGIKYSF